jgi:hypothetical protein
MMSKLNDMYYAWLKGQVDYDYKKHTRTSYTQLMDAMWSKPFPWVVANDDNRVEDGLELRYLFLNDEDLRHEFEIMQAEIGGGPNMIQAIHDFRAQPCSTLEVLIALSRRLAFNTNGTPEWWAWRLIKNLDLHEMHDPLTSKKLEQVDETLERLIWRTYLWDGAGGFFPLQDPKDDQRKVEIWYQMSAYLAEFDLH